MRWILFGVALIPLAIFIALLGSGLSGPKAQSAVPIINTQSYKVESDRKLAPDFKLGNLTEQEPIVLSALRGNIVLLDFWSSWCPPCRIEAPELVAAYSAYKNAPVEFIGISVWDDATDAAQHINKYQVNYLNGIDSNGEIALDYGVKGLPEKYLINRQGLIVGKYAGPMSRQMLRNLIDTLLIEP